MEQQNALAELRAIRDPDDTVGTLRAELTQLIHEAPGPLAKISVSRGDAAIEVSWSTAQETDPSRCVGVPAHGEAVGRDRTTIDDPDAPSADPDLTDVISPLVGTFYAAPEPGADPFVAIGDVVNPRTTIGIVEAMKLMNPVEASVTGTIAEVLVENGQPVEYGEVLLRIRSDDT